MRGEVTFTMREATRYSLIDSLLEGKMVNKDAASALRLSLRQVKRIKRRWRRWSHPANPLESLSVILKNNSSYLFVNVVQIIAMNMG